MSIMQKKDIEKDLLTYSASIAIPLTLSALGTTVLLVGSLPLSSSIVVGGLVFITGFQAVSASINFCKNIKNHLKELNDIKEKEEIETPKVSESTKEKEESLTLNKEYSQTISYPRRLEKAKVLVKKKY